VQLKTVHFPPAEYWLQELDHQRQLLLLEEDVVISEPGDNAAAEPVALHLYG
jgi:hypothetical protein